MKALAALPLPPARDRLGKIINQALADEFALSLAARDFHWNVSGPGFRSLHELFDEQYREIDAWIEKIGERARFLGVAAQSAWGDLIKAPRLTPARGADLSAERMLAELATLHDTIAGRFRSDAELASALFDPATGEFFRSLVEYHEAQAWMLGELLHDRERAPA